MDDFVYVRKIHFSDTDGAGVVYFANLLSICHEAYEEYLETRLNLNLKNFFADALTAIPVIHAQMDFRQPLFCGDRIKIKVLPQLISDKVFEVTYHISKDDVNVAQGLTRHICINPQTRKTQSLPHFFQRFVI